MTTAISTVVPSLTPSQQAAREFWRQAGADGMPPFYVMSQHYAQLSTNSDNLPVVTAALDQLLTGLGYATDVDTIFRELPAGRDEELGYWAGHYCLFDSDGNRFDLVVGRNGATLTVPPPLVEVTALPAGTDMASVTVLSGASFKDGVLQLANAQFQASLNFSLPVRTGSFDTGAAMFQSTAPRCQGTFGSRQVNGKRGAWTQAGVGQTADGDPAAAWYGQYVLLDVTDVTKVVQEPKPVCIYNDPSFGLTFQWGNVYGSNVTYSNNVLQCADEGDDRTRFAMQFVAPQPGAAEINLAVSTAGAVRSYKGYWVGRYPLQTPQSHARLAKRPMTAVYSAGSDAPAGGYSQAIDMSSLTPDGKTTIRLPYGAVGNNYALSLDLTGCPATDTFSWTVSNDATGRATITPSGGTNQTALFSLANLGASDAGQHLQVTVQLTNKSAAPPATYTLLFDIAVIQCEAISLEPTVLMPVVVGTPCTQGLMAHGALGNFTWSVTYSLPPGLTWDDSHHQLAGKVTDPTQVGKAFSLVVGLAAPDVIMDQLTVSLSITVQPAQAVASAMPPWARIVLFGGAGSLIVIGIIVAAIVDRIKQGIVDAETKEAIRAGNTYIDSATDGDPRFATQSILESESEEVSAVERIIPAFVKELTQLYEQEGIVADQLLKSEARLLKLKDYVTSNPDDKPDDPVEDTDLNDLGYRTYGQVERDIPGWAAVAKHYAEAVSGLLHQINQVQAVRASGVKWLDDTSSSDSNDKDLLTMR
jgi:hypothetical protein